jgi:hypothetical protein
MRKLMLVPLLFLLISPAFGMGGAPSPAPSTKGSLVIEDFENVDPNKGPEWWAFDNLTMTLVPGKDSRRALGLRGVTRGWYVGGVGKYIGKDAGKYNTFDIDIFGTGKESELIRIELYDDDNGNWQIEQEPRNNYAPTKDDRFIVEFKVDWTGWKHVSIPVSEFVDNNPGVGDDIWNPDQANGSGGLIQMQIIVNSTGKVGKADLIIDNIEMRESQKR